MKKNTHSCYVTVLAYTAYTYLVVCNSFAHKKYLSLTYSMVTNEDVTIKHYKSHLHQQANLHLCSTLKSRVLLGFSRYNQLSKMKSCHKKLARSHLLTSLLRQAWACWLQRCEQKEEALLEPLTQQARCHSSLVALRKGVASWFTYVRLCRNKKRLKLQADQHFRDVALPK